MNTLPNRPLRQMRLLLVALILLVTVACNVKLGAQVAVLAPQDLTQRPGFVAAVLDRLANGEAAAAIRAAVPSVTDRELASLQVTFVDVLVVNASRGPGFQCWIDIYDERGNAAAVACGQAIQRALEAQAREADG